MSHSRDFDSDLMYCRINSGELTLKMPSGRENSRVDVEFKFPLASNLSTARYVYTYMPNPEVSNVPRQQGIVR